MMRIAGLVAPVLLLAACGGDAPAAATLDAIPAQYVGHWDSNADDCATGGSPDVISIDPKQVVFADSALAVRGVSPDGERAARVDGLFTAATGEEWEGSVRLELADGVLTIVNGTPVVPRVKCP
jgi:hypothetical protein